MLSYVRSRAAIAALLPLLALGACGPTEASAADITTCSAARDDLTEYVGEFTSAALDQVSDGEDVSVRVRTPTVQTALSGYAPDDDRLVRAVENAREDLQAWQSAANNAKADVAPAVAGSLPAVLAVCDDLGA